MATPEFILQLRRSIGHAPLWLMGATVVCLRDGERGPEVLLERRADNGLWATISGIVEPGEHPTDCLVREAMEEVGAEVEVGRMLWCAVTEPKTYANGDRTQYLDHGYLGRVVGGTLRPDGDETTDVGWFPVDRLPEPQHPRLGVAVRIAQDAPGDVVASLEP
ncbi:NUDIX domain-containing protein [uncultured Tessaracoccus sp.]|uniref:NUDIX hydrolase n=1 Tax=uncultured Tessaracoccus sp. TaxID=905023 RepID=UPI0025F05870|nr:NUDIX domain-containing protein [uncultured Tessaracoccus sp.]